jgi:hypothetical protein
VSRACEQLKTESSSEVPPIELYFWVWWPDHDEDVERNEPGEVPQFQ